MITPVEIIRKIQRPIVRSIKPKDKYSLFPISSVFGLDRGIPIDRYYIEEFMEKNKSKVTGVCLEVTDNKYTKKFGGSKVICSDVLDINKKNKKANIHGDLRDLKAVVPDDKYDCIILTHVLGLIDDCDRAVAECFRLLKPGGTLLFTGSCLGPLLEEVHWRFTPYSVQYLLSKYFKKTNLTIQSFGNAKIAQAFIVGMSQSDLSPQDFEYNDSKFPIAVTAIAIK